VIEMELGDRGFEAESTQNPYADFRIQSVGFGGRGTYAIEYNDIVQHRILLENPFELLQTPLHRWMNRKKLKSGEYLTKEIAYRSPDEILFEVEFDNLTDALDWIISQVANGRDFNDFQGEYPFNLENQDFFERFGAEDFALEDGQRIPHLTLKEWSAVSKALGEVGTFHNWNHELTDGEGGNGTTLVVDKRNGVFGRRNEYMCNGCGKMKSAGLFGEFRKHEPLTWCEYCEDEAEERYGAEGDYTQPRSRKINNILWELRDLNAEQMFYTMLTYLPTKQVNQLLNQLERGLEIGEIPNPNMRLGAEEKRYPRSPNDEILDGLSEMDLRSIIWAYGAEIKSMKDREKYLERILKKAGVWYSNPTIDDYMNEGMTKSEATSAYYINRDDELFATISYLLEYANKGGLKVKSFEAEVPILGKGKEFKQQQPLLPQKVIDRLREQSIIRDNLGGTFVGDFIAIRDSVGGYYKKGDKAKITILEEEADENYDEYDNYIGPLLYEINLVGGISLVADPVDFENNWVEGFGAETFEAKGIDTFTEPFGELRTGSILNKAILLGSLGAGAMIGLKLRK